MKKMNKKGFTLIEMLVVIAIIAILVAIVIPTVNNATKKAKQATDVANIRSAIAEYEIETLTDPDATFPFDTVQGDLNYGDQFTQSDDGTTVSYTADLLQDDAYEWTVGNIYSED